MAKAQVNGLRHVGVAVPDYDKQVAFYEDVWGLKKVDGESGTPADLPIFPGHCYSVDVLEPDTGGL